MAFKKTHKNAKDTKIEVSLNTTLLFKYENGGHPVGII